MTVATRDSETPDVGPAPRFTRPHGTSSEHIANEIRRYIAAEGLLPDDRLGTERELASEFGVSRPTLREALRLLAGSHLVRTSRGPGGGVFVASTPNEGIGRNLSESIATMLETGSVSLLELVETRIHLEVPLAGLAAQNATEQTVAELEEAIERARGHHPASDPFRVADLRFHRVIAKTSGNELLRAFAGWTLDVLQPSVIARIGGSFDADTILRQHRAIARAIRRGQVSGAQRAMLRHLEYVRERIRTVGADDT